MRRPQSHLVSFTEAERALALKVLGHVLTDLEVDGSDALIQLSPSEAKTLEKARRKLRDESWIQA